MFEGTCLNTKRKRIIVTPTLADGVTPAPIDARHPLTAEAPNGESGFLSEPATDPDTGETLTTECLVSMPNGFVGDVEVEVVADPDMGDGEKRLTERGLIHFVNPAAPEAEVLGTQLGADEDKLPGTP